MPLLLALSLVFGRAAANSTAAVTKPSFEVWVMDQSDSTEDGGGTLYIYPGDPLTADAATVEPEVVDLGGAARDLCLTETGVAPKRPHMLMFNASHSHAIITFVATGHVLFMDAASRESVACIDVGEQAHAAYPSPDESFAIVANQNGKLLQRIATDFANERFVLDDGATLNLATCVTPSEAPCEDPNLRPDNAPICPIITNDGRFTAVTLRGGGLLVVDNTTSPLAIVAEYDRTTIRPNGCGGLESAGQLYLTAGGGTTLAPYAADLYVFPVDAFGATASPPNTPTPSTIFSYGEGADAHGAVLTGDGDYIWIADRAANRIIVVDTVTNEVLDGIDLTGDLTSDPAPDLMDISPDGGWVFLTMRGPAPLTANVEGIDNAVGATPGLGVVQVQADGRLGELAGLAAITHPDGDGERADPHGMRVRPT